MSERIAAIADIHANVWALEAVLADVKRRGVTAIVNLGDILHGALQPRATYELLMRTKVAATIRGNQDREIYEATADQLRTDRRLSYILDDLGADPVAWLRTLPPAAVFGEEILLCHGTPASDLVYLLEEVNRGVALVRPEVAIRELLADVRQPVILCGHTHIPRVVQLANGQLVVNPGSVGLPAYRDDLPVPHAMETYAPLASYAVLEKRSGAWNVSFERVAYDCEAAARCAESHGRADWAYALRTGRTLA